jgi:hypothetical protein
MPDIFKLPLAELERRVARAEKLIAELRTLLPGLVSLSEEERKFSQGRMRTDESKALRHILDAVDIEPSYFKSLADDDEGLHTDHFETELLRERLDRRALLRRISDQLGDLHYGVDDTILTLGALVRPVALAAYRIAKTLAHTDARLRRAIAPAVAFYSGPSRAAAAKRGREPVKTQDTKTSKRDTSRHKR